MDYALIVYRSLSVSNNKHFLLCICRDYDSVHEITIETIDEDLKRIKGLTYSKIFLIDLEKETLSKNLQFYLEQALISPIGDIEEIST